MPRRKSMATIDARIDAVKKTIAATKARYERLCDELRALQTEREDLMAKEVLAALKRSGKSYQELMTFLRRS